MDSISRKQIESHRCIMKTSRLFAGLLALSLSHTHPCVNAQELAPRPGFSPAFESIQLSYGQTTYGHPVGTAYAIALASDGKFYLGGAFTSGLGAARLNLARFNADGTLDTTFQPATVNGAVRALQIQPDGRLLIAGEFTQVGGVDRSGIARLNEDGSLDTGFDPGSGFDDKVFALALAPDGGMFVGGRFMSFNGILRKRVAHLNTDGSLDDSFDPGDGPIQPVYSLAVQPDGRLLVGSEGTAYNLDFTYFYGLYRLNTDGTLDLTFEPPWNDTIIRGMALQPDGKFLVIGELGSWDGVYLPGVARLNPDGSRDLTFNPATDNILSETYAVALLPNAKILVAGDGNWGGSGQPGIVLLKSNGALDSSFNAGGGFGDNHTGNHRTVFGLALQPDGRILATGNFRSYADLPIPGIVRLTSDGSLDFPALETGLQQPGTVNGAVPMAGGRVLVFGQFERANGLPRTNLVVLNADGSVDTNSWPVGFDRADAEVTAAAVQEDGKIIIGGRIAAAVGFGTITRLDPSGAVDVDNYVDPISKPGVLSLALQPDGKLLFNGAWRYNTDASLDPSFSATYSGGSQWNSASKVVVRPDGKIIVAGDFTAVDGVPRNHLARLNSDGSLDVTFDPGNGFNGAVAALAVQSDGKLIVGGDFSGFNGAGRNRIARLNPDGTLDTSFSVGSGFNGAVQSLYLQPDGKVVAAGRFTSFSGTPRRYFARLNPDGSLDDTMAVPTVVEGSAQPPDAISANPDLAKVSIPVLLDAGKAHSGRVGLGCFSTIKLAEVW